MNNGCVPLFATKEKPYVSSSGKSSSVLILLASLLLAGCQPIQPEPAQGQADTPAADIAPLLGNLGDHHRAITTDSEEAQQYFDQGLMLAYGFNHEEAIQSFQEALQARP